MSPGGNGGPTYPPDARLIRAMHATDDPWAEMQDRLEAEREETTRRIEALSQGFDAIVESSAMTVPDDEHDPDGSTIGFERAQLAALLRQARIRLDDLDRARDRLRDGVYGVCDRCGRPIALERLMTLPSAATCVACAANAT